MVNFNSTSSKYAEEYSGDCEIVAMFMDLKKRRNLPNYFLIVSVAAIVVNAVFAFTAMLGNVLVLTSVLRTPFLRCPSNVLLCSLAVSDFFVGFLSQPLFVTRNIALLSRNLALYCKMHVGMAITGYIFATASLVTLTAMSVERFLALHFHMRYNSVVTVQRTGITVVVYWLLVISLSLLFWYTLNGRAALILIPLLSIPCVLICFWSYWKIFRISRRHRRHIRRNQIQTFHITQWNCDQFPDFRRYKKSTNSLLYYISALVLCYVPYILLVVITLQSDEEDMRISAVSQMAMTIIFLNSSLNPPIYFWRVNELRSAARKTLRDFAGCFQNCLHGD